MDPLIDLLVVTYENEKMLIMDLKLNLVLVNRVFVKVSIGENELLRNLIAELVEDVVYESIVNDILIVAATIYEESMRVEHITHDYVH